MKNLEEELVKQKPDPQKLKMLFIRTHGQRRTNVLSMMMDSTRSIFLKYPMLRKCSYVSTNLRVIIFYVCCYEGQNCLKLLCKDLKENFDEEFIIWSKAVVNYCKRKCTKIPPFKSW